MPSDFVQERIGIRKGACTDNMIATYYEDIFCQKIHSFQLVKGWDSEGCKPIKY